MRARSADHRLGTDVCRASYVLADDLKREEVLDPRMRKIGLFRQTDVFPRSAVLVVKAPEAWMREGRRVRTGEQPMKFVKRRAVTLNRKREQEVAKMDGEEPPQQGLYALRQTELAMPDPIVDVRATRRRQPGEVVSALTFTRRASSRAIRTAIWTSSPTTWSRRAPVIFAVRWPCDQAGSR